MTTAEAQAAGDARAALRRAAVFSGYSRADLGTVLGFTSARTVRPRRAVFAQGEPCEALYVLGSGSVKLLRKDDNGRDKVTGFVDAGETFAESALFHGAGYPVTAVTLTATTLFAVAAEPFLAFLLRRPGCCLALLSRLGAQVASLTEQLENTVTRTAEQKVAAYILERARENGSSQDKLNAAHSRRDLASLLAITPETLSRTITEFRRRNWISTDRRRIVVKDPERLARAMIT